MVKIEEKANRTESIRTRYQNSYKKQNQIFIDCWFSENTQKLLKQAAKKF